MYRPDEHLAASLGTPDDVVYDEVDTVLLVFVVHVDTIPQNNTVCKARGPFIPWLKPRGFLAFVL
jgi:hypothetical protein